MLVKLHESHFGVEKTRNLAKDIMYWPGMSAQIEDYVSKCGMCLENKSSYQKESMIPSTISELPWQVVYPGIQFRLPCTPPPGKFSWVPNCSLGPPGWETKVSSKKFWFVLCEIAWFLCRPIANFRRGGLPIKLLISQLLLILDY